MPDPDQEYKRGQDAAKIDSHLAEHDRQLIALNSAVNQTAGEVRGLGQQVGNLSHKFEQSLAIAAARASDAEKAAKRQVTSRELYFTAAGLLIALAGLLSATGHL